MSKEANTIRTTEPPSRVTAADGIIPEPAYLEEVERTTASANRKARSHTDSVRRTIARVDWRLRSQQVLLAVLLVASWQLLISFGLVERFWISDPQAVATRIIDLVETSQIWPHLWATVTATFVGFAIGALTGVTVGLMLGIFRHASRLLDPLVMGLYSLPRVALAPLFIMYFGIGLASKVALVVSLVFFIMLLNTRAGVLNVDVELVDAVRTMGAGRRFIIRRVVLPSTAPWIASGARIAVVFALMGAVVGEMLGSRAGLGRLLSDASNLWDTTGVFALLLITGTVAVFINWVLSLVERRLQRYSESA